MISLIKLFENIDEEMHLYHGSRHNFDCFKLEKVGAGIGNQGYGWGIYLSINELTSLGYSALTSVKDEKAADIHKIGGNDLHDLEIKHDNMVFMRIPQNNFQTAEQLIEYAQNVLEMLEDEDPNKEDSDIQWKISEYQDFIQIIKDHYFKEEVKINKGVTHGIGYMYKVILNKGKDPKDYDLLSNKSPITTRQKNKILNYSKKIDINLYNKLKEYTGNGFGCYSIIKNYYDNEYKASQFLLKAGIDGNIINNGDKVIIFDVKKLQIVDKCRIDTKTRKYID